MKDAEIVSTPLGVHFNLSKEHSPKTDEDKAAMAKVPYASRNKDILDLLSIYDIYNKGQKGLTDLHVCTFAGIDNNETIKIYRSGGADPDGDNPGDLYVTMKVREDPVFRREGSDIHVDAVLSITQAILGGTIQVPTLTGDVVLKVRPGTQPGQKVVLKKKGIKTKNSYTFGDQYVHFNVSIPNNLTERQRELIEEFTKEEQDDFDDKQRAASASG
ncbi:chaperone protein dnaJ GFA2, mitochondrial-like [Cajanus cajan]|uniref:chaperone protein dnaJ GFA2, mitochondrial-like n=1 Tax=Cajanus cajan TaxID=3821 RepID=UPI00098DC565|nr:chaperone protein dnaJ GFA2, mitochondrial-like [Cajanus cajan]